MLQPARAAIVPCLSGKVSEPETEAGPEHSRSGPALREKLIDIVDLRARIVYRTTGKAGIRGRLFKAVERLLRLLLWI